MPDSRPRLLDALVAGLEDARPRTRMFGGAYYEKATAAMVGAFVYSSSATLGHAMAGRPEVAALVWDGALDAFEQFTRLHESRRDAAVESFEGLGLTSYYLQTQFPELYTPHAMLRLVSNPRLARKVAAEKVDAATTLQAWRNAAAEGLGLGFFSTAKVVRLLESDYRDRDPAEWERAKAAGLDITDEGPTISLDDRVAELTAVAEAMLREFYPEVLPFAEDRGEAYTLVRHVQKMYALQQLAMEIYNDALSAASGAPSFNEQSFTRQRRQLSDKDAVQQVLIPALERKLELMNRIDQSQRLFPRPSEAISSTAYDEFTLLVSAMTRRAQAQWMSMMLWTADPSRDDSEGLAGLDAEEQAAVTRSAQSLNSVIAAARLQPIWLAINTEVFNEVRGELGLPALTIPEFERRFVAGLNGESIRYFTD